jgi:hypothetical protein
MKESIESKEDLIGLESIQEIKEKSKNDFSEIENKKYGILVQMFISDPR